MRALLPCFLILCAVACRAKEPTSEPQPSSVATSVDTEPSPVAADTPPAVVSAVASSTVSAVTSSERPAGPFVRSSHAPRPSTTAGAIETPAASAPSPSTPSPSPSTKIAEIRTKRGATAAGPSYDVWLETTGGYTPGASAAIVAVVNAKPPYKCNAQYPYKFVLDAPPPGLSYPNSTVRGMRVDGKHASMPVPFVATDAGSHSVSGTLSFSTCTEDKCLVDTAHLSVVVEVR